VIVYVPGVVLSDSAPDHGSALPSTAPSAPVRGWPGNVSSRSVDTRNAPERTFVGRSSFPVPGVTMSTCRR
jgi:hypothetical protein